MIAFGSFLLAAAADVATDQTRSSLFGGAAIGISVLALFPRGRNIVGRVSGVAATWLLFNMARAQSDGAGLAVISSGFIAEVEARLLGSSPSALLQDLRPSGTFGTLVDTTMVAVYLSFFLIPVAMAALAAIDRPDHVRRTMAATGSCLLVGTVGFLLFPTTPPWMADADGVARLTPQVMSTALGLDLVDGPASDQAGYSFDPNHLAAMPSIHVAATVLFALVVASSWHRVAPIVWAHAAMMTVAVVFVGEHHVLDAVAGWTVALAGWGLAGRLVVALDRRRVVDHMLASSEVAAPKPTHLRRDTPCVRNQCNGPGRVR